MITGDQVPPKSRKIESNNGLTSFAGTGLVYDQRMALHKHEWNSTEIECPARASRSIQRCEELGLLNRCRRLPVEPASEKMLQLLHDKEYIDLIKSTSSSDPETLEAISRKFDGVFLNKHTWDAAMLSLGGAIQLTDAVVSGKLQNAMSIARPPGHHAMEGEGCGYCVFNNVAIAAKHALDDLGLHRVLVLDWDVHHGQGTQYAFYDDPRVMYISIHRYDDGNYWPNLRESNYDFIGSGKGKGFNINVPLNEIGLTESDYFSIFRNLILPVSREFNPQLVLVSCGFDAAIGCPEGLLDVHPAAYGHFVHHLKTLAAGKLVLILEGGYCVESLAEGVCHCVKALLGDTCPRLRPAQPIRSSVREIIQRCVAALRPFWKCLQVHDIRVEEVMQDISDLKTRTWQYIRDEPFPEINPQHSAETLLHLREFVFPGLMIQPEPEGRTRAVTQAFHSLTRKSLENGNKTAELSEEINPENTVKLLTERIISNECTSCVLTGPISSILQESIKSLSDVHHNVKTFNKILFIEFSLKQGWKEYLNKCSPCFKSVCVSFSPDITESSSGWVGNIYQINIKLDTELSDPNNLHTIFNYIVAPLGYQFGPDVTFMAIEESMLKSLNPQSSHHVATISHLLHIMLPCSASRMFLVVDDTPDTRCQGEELLSGSRRWLGQLKGYTPYQTLPRHSSSSKCFDEVRDLKKIHKSHWSFLDF